MSLFLNMGGFIDGTFKSVDATRYREVGGGYVDGIWSEGAAEITSHEINLQPLTEKELSNIQATIGTERVVDSRKIYVNDGDLFKISPSDEWQFDGIEGRFKTFNLDNRPWNDYCKIIVTRKDDVVAI